VSNRAGSQRDLNLIGYSCIDLTSRKLLEAVLTVFAAVAAVLEATERGGRVERPTVDFDLAGADPTSDLLARSRRRPAPPPDRP